MSRILDRENIRFLKIIFYYSSLVAAIALVLGVTLARAQGEPTSPEDRPFILRAHLKLGSHGENA